MSSASTSKPFLEMFGVVLFESPWEVLVVAVLGAAVYFLRRWTKRKPKEFLELPPEQLAKAIAAHAVSAAGPMTLSLLLSIVSFFAVGHVISTDFWWLIVVFMIPAAYYGSFALRIGRSLQLQPAYAEALAIYSKDPKGLTDEALKDPEVRKRLLFWPPFLISLMQKLIILGVKK